MEGIEVAELGGAQLVEEHGLFGTIGRIRPLPDGRSMAIVHAGNPFEVYIKTISIVDTRTLRVRARLEGHTDAVYALAVSPDGSVVATGSQDRTARLWDAKTGKLLHVLGGHGLYVESVDFSPDGERVATGSFREARLWETKTGKLVAYLHGSVAVAFSPDGKVLAGSTPNKTIALWDGRTGALLRELPASQGWVRNVAFSPDGSRLAAAGYDSVRLWDTKTDAVVMSHKPVHTVHDIHFSRDGAWLAAESTARMPLWEAKTGKLMRLLDGYQLDFSPDGKVVAVTGKDRVELQETATGKVLRAVPGGRGVLLPNGTLVTSGLHGPLSVMDPGSGKLLARGAETHADQVLSVAFSSDGKALFAGQKDGAVRRWDLGTGKLLKSFTGHGGAVSALARSPDGRLIAAASADKTVHLLDAATGKLERALPLPSAPISVAFSPDGKLVATSAKDAVRVFEVATGARKRSLDLLPDSGSNVVFSPDGKFVASGSGPKVWHHSLVNGAVVRPMEGHRGQVLLVAYSPDGKTMASVGFDTTVRIWDDTTGKLRQTIHPPYWTTRALAFTPDGKQIMLIGKDISFWDIATGKHHGSIIGLDGGASSIAFSPDGALFAVGGSLGSVHLFRKDGSRVGALHALVGEDAGYLLDGHGHVDFVGARPCAARARLVCRKDALLVPFEVCEDGSRVSGLFARMMAGERVEARVEREPAAVPCAKEPPR
jgi:WD40 repeat protein